MELNALGKSSKHRFLRNRGLPPSTTRLKRILLKISAAKGMSEMPRLVGYDHEIAFLRYWYDAGFQLRRWRDKAVEGAGAYLQQEIMEDFILLDDGWDVIEGPEICQFLPGILPHHTVIGASTIPWKMFSYSENWIFRSSWSSGVFDASPTRFMKCDSQFSFPVVL